MKEYKFCYCRKYLSEWFIGVKENETAEVKWLDGTFFKTKKAALSKFKTMYAPLGTKEIVKIKTLTEYEVYEAR